MVPERQNDPRDWRDPRSWLFLEKPTAVARISRIARMAPERQNDPRDWRPPRLAVSENQLP
jgi:hypothetical protein